MHACVCIMIQEMINFLAHYHFVPLTLIHPTFSRTAYTAAREVGVAIYDNVDGKYINNNGTIIHVHGIGINLPKYLTTDFEKIDDPNWMVRV